MKPPLPLAHFRHPVFRRAACLGFQAPNTLRLQSKPSLVQCKRCRRTRAFKNKAGR